VRDAINLIWKISVGAELAVAIRLLSQGLAGEYPALLAACCILPIKSLLLIYSFFSAIPQDQVRQISENLAPIEWIVSAWIVFELFSRWTRSYTGIGRFGKLLLAALLGIALVVSVCIWRVEWEALVFRANFRIYYILNRVVYGTLGLFVLGTWLFFRNYPVAIAPNVVRHTYIAMVYFVGCALCQLVFTLNGRKSVPLANLAGVTITVGSFASWALLLTRKGQVAPPLQQVSPEDRERIERINEELLVFMGNVPKSGR
jgi:hypothetical protein